MVKKTIADTPVDTREQIFYNGKWFARDDFRAFVYKGNEQLLCHNYDDFLKHTSEGWNEHKTDLLPNPGRERMKLEGRVAERSPLDDEAAEDANFEKVDEPYVPPPARPGRKKKADF